MQHRIIIWKQFAEIGRDRRCATESYDSTFDLEIHLGMNYERRNDKKIEVEMSTMPQG